MIKKRNISFSAAKALFFILLFQSSHLMLSFDGPIKLRRACLNATDSTITLYFNKLTDPCVTFSKIEVNGRVVQTNPGAFVNLYSSSSLPVGENISFKQPNLNVWEYFITYHFMCDGSTILYSDTISIDLVPPTFLEMDSVSVDLATQKAIIGWPKNPSIDHKGYLVFERINSNNVQISDQIIEGYIHLPSNPVAGPLTYTYNSYDSCNNFNILAQHHTTVHLVSANNVCQKQINLNWTPYQGWNTDKYYIYRSLNGSSFELIDSTPSLKYTNLNAINGALYCFYIRAKKEFSSITSTSNITCTTFPNPISASNTHIKGVSVIDDNTIEIKWYTEDTERTIDASLYRAQGSNSPVFIKKIPFQNGINRILDTVPTDKTGYSYRIILNDSCPVNNDSSGISQSVFLSRDQTELQWTSYVFERSTNNGDHIFASSSTWNSLGITNQMGQSTWIVPEDSAFCYRVISISIDGDSSISNTVCIEDDLRVYIPTAIKLNGLSDNKYFGIFGTGIDWEKSSIGIFTRWGELIFQLQKSQQTWDGTYQQKPVQAGIYMYTGIIIGVKGDRIPVKGTILIIN